MLPLAGKGFAGVYYLPAVGREAIAPGFLGRCRGREGLESRDLAYSQGSEAFQAYICLLLTAGRLCKGVFGCRAARKGFARLHRHAPARGEALQGCARLPLAGER